MHSVRGGPDRRLDEAQRDGEASQDERPQATSGGTRGLGRGLAPHLVAVGAAMVGVCLTVAELIRLGQFGGINTVVDNVLAADAVVFLATCLAAYFSLRTDSPARARRFEGIADVVFIAGVLVLVGLAAFVALEIF